MSGAAAINVCAGDISHVGGECPDGVVDVYDLMTLCNNWNTDGAGADLAEPYDVVDVFDLFMVIGENWACHIGADPGTESHQDVVENAGLTMSDWNEYMDVLQYSEDEEEKENYNCWMLQYLSECVFCPPCSGEDPYK